MWADGCAALRQAMRHADVPEADADAYLATFTDRAALDAAINWYRAAARSGGLRAADTPDVTVPVLYLWGTADQSVGRKAAELTVEHVTGPYRFVEIDGAGHFLTDDLGAPTVERELIAHVTR
jgi:pimeloyl-ACP methyl ester carboxylesterase